MRWGLSGTSCLMTVATLSGLNVDYVGLCQFPQHPMASFSLLSALTSSQGAEFKTGQKFEP